MSYVFPVIGQWRWGGGVEEHQSRPLGNWQSDNAVDIMAPAGSTLVSPAAGRIVKISGSDPSGGPRGTLFGRSITIQEPGGRQWFVTHIDNPIVRVGQFVTAGSPVSRIADWGKNSHAHIGVSQGDPRSLLGGAPSVGPSLPTTVSAGAATATSGAGCLPYLIANFALLGGLIFGVVKGVMLL